MALTFFLNLLSLYKNFMDRRDRECCRWLVVMFSVYGGIVLAAILTMNIEYSLHISVADAGLVRFSAFAAPNATSAALSYDLRVALQVYNAIYLGVVCEFLMGNYYFNGTRLAGLVIAPFFLESGNTTVLRMDVAGGAEGGGLAFLDEFERGSRAGVFDLELQLDGFYRPVVDGEDWRKLMSSSERNPCLLSVRCPLTLPLASPAGGGSAVDTIECKLDINPAVGCRH